MTRAEPDDDMYLRRRLMRRNRESVELKDALKRQMREAKLARDALRAIIERADTDKPGTSKVQDMRYIAVKALEG